MISNQILQDTIDGIKAITRIDLCVMDTDGNKAYALPFYKRGVLVEEGDLVRIFVPKDVFLYDRGSITNFSEVWGYEVVPELNEDRNRRLGIED